MSHTKGPWKCFPHDIFNNYAISHAESNNGDLISTDEALANAHLIAAAPDLLEALKIILVQYGEYKDGDGDAKYHAVNIAKEAIKKAEGLE